MSMEQSGQQNLNLVPSTSGKHSSPKKRQKFSNEYNWRIRISLKAQDKTCVFTNLLKHINTDTLREAYHAINGKKARGVDQISKLEYGKELESNLRDLENRIHKGSYRPLAKREVLIPKGNGKLRPIAIASFEDKLVDWCVGAILQEVYEPMFIKNSFGYRPGKSAHDAIEASYKTLEDGTRSNIVEIDFTNFFNSIPHKKLMKILEKRISDKRMLGLVRRLLTGEILKSTGELEATEQGTPQGGIASPILANVYLNEVLDQWFVTNYGSAKSILVRYADDAVFFFKSKDNADKFLKELHERVREYGIELNQEKTKQITLDKKSRSSFNFLGFTFYRGKQGSRKILKIKTQKEKLLRGIENFYQWIKANRNRIKLNEIWKIAKSKITGHINYYGYWMNGLKLNHFIFECQRSLYKWLNRRSQKRSYTWAGFIERLKNFPLSPALDKIKLKQLGSSFGRI